LTIGKIHTTKHSYRIRLVEPSKFKKFRKINLGKGIKGVIGIKKTLGKRGGKTELQSIIVPKELGKMRAKKYLKKFK
jgi:hypothetical protein